MAYLNKINIFDRNTLKRALCLHGQILSPIKQNEEILQLFPRFTLFSILFSQKKLSTGIQSSPKQNSKRLIICTIQILPEAKIFHFSNS